MPDTWIVTPLVEGAGYSSSCTLLTRGSERVLVDTGLSIEESELQTALSRAGLVPDDIDLVINTHLHLDHCGNNALFHRARIAFSQREWRWTDAFYTAIFSSSTPERAALEFYPELAGHGIKSRTIRNVARLARMFWSRDRLGAERQFHWLEDDPLPSGLTILETPGHTPHHVSLAVASSPPVIIAGDAVLHESLDAKVRTMIPYSAAEFAATREQLLQRGVRLVPGHGPAFQPQPVPTR